MFGRNPAWNTFASSAAPASHPACYSERSVALLPFPRIGLPAIPVATRRRSAQFPSSIPIREILLRSRQDSRFPIPPQSKSLRICTCEKRTRAAACPRRNHLELSTFNCELSTQYNPFRIRTYTKRGGGRVLHISTLTLDSRTVCRRNLVAQVGRPVFSLAADLRFLGPERPRKMRSGGERASGTGPAGCVPDEVVQAFCLCSVLLAADGEPVRGSTG
jgi:hypothetical protein